MLRPILSAEQIQARVHALAAELDAAYAEAPDLVLVGVLRGAVYFLSDLSRALHHPHRLDFVEYASYAGTERGDGAFHRAARGPIAGADVVLIDEVADSGATIEALRQALTDQQPRSLATCVLLWKAGCPVEPEYVGFRLGREFLVGYGLDFNQQLRHLPYVARLEGPDAIADGAAGSNAAAPDAGTDERGRA